MDPPFISEPHTQSPSRKEAWIPGLRALEVKGQAELSKEASGGPQGVPHLRQEGPKSASFELGLKPVPLALEREEGNQDVGRKQNDHLGWVLGACLPSQPCADAGPLPIPVMD